MISGLWWSNHEESDRAYSKFGWTCHCWQQASSPGRNWDIGSKTIKYQIHYGRQNDIHVRETADNDAGMILLIWTILTAIFMNLQYCIYHAPM